MREIKNQDEFWKIMKKWKLDDGPIDREWKEASSRTKFEYDDNYEVWKRDKFIKEMAMDDVGYDHSIKQKVVSKAERRNRNHWDDMFIRYSDDISCPRSEVFIDREPGNVIWRKEADDKDKERWEGKKERRKEK
jgi:hypothetical protein